MGGPLWGALSIFSGCPKWPPHFEPGLANRLLSSFAGQEREAEGSFEGMTAPLSSVRGAKMGVGKTRKSQETPRSRSPSLPNMATGSIWKAPGPPEPLLSHRAPAGAPGPRAAPAGRLRRKGPPGHLQPSPAQPPGPATLALRPETPGRGQPGAEAPARVGAPPGCPCRGAPAWGALPHISPRLEGRLGRRGGGQRTRL